MSKDKVQGVVVNVISHFEDGAKLLYLKRSGGQYADQWWPVAGTSEENEPAIETALRELMEETGLSPTRVYALGKEVPHIDGTQKIAGFVAIVNPSDRVRLNYEHSEYRWMPLAAAIDAVWSWTNRQALEALEVQQ